MEVVFLMEGSEKHTRLEDILYGIGNQNYLLIKIVKLCIFQHCWSTTMAKLQMTKQLIVKLRNTYKNNVYNSSATSTSSPRVYSSVLGYNNNSSLSQNNHIISVQILYRQVVLLSDPCHLITNNCMIIIILNSSLQCKKYWNKLNKN